MKDEGFFLSSKLFIYDIGYENAAFPSEQKLLITISDINYYTRDKILYLLLLKIRGTKEFVVELSNIRKSFSIFISSPMNKTKSSAINIHRKIVRNRSPKRPKRFFKLSTASNQRILLQKRIFATFPSVFHR